MADGYSTYVNWAKTILPLAALGLLSTLFLFARAPSIDEAQLPYRDIEELAREQQINAPAFSGVTDDGAIVSVAADRARPVDDAGQVIEITVIRGTIRNPGGAQIEIRAGSGRLDSGTNIAELSDLARIDTSDGYQVETTGLTASLDTGRLETTGPLEAHAPFGELTAGRLVVESTDGTASRMIFNEGVRLVYRPQSTRED
ncbi:LPS export ABC transporter periplasmic protein LptC [Pelagovum pacificum]|uniref:LPS export ABC transporter periplasmic protein LptC n=1 Tax=Pelagovum pacificum TaxID=2588711 RepID=A0A5C5GJA8_9RHOB|nr:LPS export ABC transporter periplasmic protein LptC [Pelagovum pacificum]QQA42865.1 LPS export ABC transporter periplasmic protein LptC [Pelagovum pacificum]TNY33989.1 hypothetical protein FHY64_12210 [Pelagovum pacificum]